MKKIVCMLLLIQSGFVMAQTETFVTVDGRRIKININPIVAADNGLSSTLGNVQLGGDLLKPTTLTTTSINTLAIQGLETGMSTDQLLTTDKNGVLRKIENNSWNLNGNEGTTAGTNFIGTTDNQDIVLKRGNTFSGLISLTNTAFGFGSMKNNENHYADNSAFGSHSMNKNISGSQNTAIGSMALMQNETGSFNTAIGMSALANHKNGNDNTTVGYNTLSGLESGSDNVAIGSGAGAVGFKVDISSADYSIFIGAGSKPLAKVSENEIVIGYNAIGRGSNTVTIGNEAITSIGGYAPWSNYSDSRLKKNIVSSTYGLDFINKLRPVLYNMKTGTIELQSGFIAQEVEAAANSIGYKFSGVVKPQTDNDFYSLRYSDFVVPLVKAVQEQQKQLEERDVKIAELENRLLKIEQKLK